MTSFKDQLFYSFVLFLLINTPVSAAIHGSETAFFEEESEIEPAVVVEPIREEFTCATGEMSALDTQKFLDLLRDGFLGGEFASGEDDNKPREKIENSTVIIPLGENEDGVSVGQKVELPNQKFDANEAQHLMNDWIQGPFAYGLVLTDTLRVGRCVGLADENIPCPVEGKNLNLRNSGTGIKSDFTPIMQFFKDAYTTYGGGLAERASGLFSSKDVNFFNEEQGDWDEDDYRDIREAMDLPADAQEALTEYAASSDLNETQVQTMTRTVGKMISNSILTQNFYAYSQTTCNTSNCIINTYSLFDKYYNNWFSFDMVMGITMPALLGRTKKLFMNLSRKGQMPWRISDSALANSMRRKFYAPGSDRYNRLAKRMWHRAESAPEVGKLRFELMETQGWQDGMLLTQSRPFRDKFEKEWMNSGGWFDKITDGRTQKEMYEFTRDVEKWQKINRAHYLAAKSEYLPAYKMGLGTASEKAARVEYGRKIAGLMTGSETAVHLDLPEWFSRDGSARMFYYAVKPQGSDATRWLASDSIDIFDVMKKFEVDGDFAGAWAKGKSGFSGYSSTGKNLNLYAFDPKAQKVGEATGSELRDHFSNYTDLFVKTDPGEVMPVKDATLPYVSNVMTGKKDTFAGAIAKSREMSPDEFAQRLVNNHRLGSFFDHYGSDNAEKLVQGMQSKGFMKRSYTSILDRAMMNQSQLITNYFKPGKGPLKWTAYFNTYWWAKRGFGNENISAYMLPDTWREVRWPLGPEPIYNDAFVDFFSHEGSDQGDMFKRMLNVMPYQYLSSELLSKYKPTKDLYEKLTDNKLLRNKVENIAFYGSTENDCAGCGVSMDSERNFQEYSAFFFTEQMFKSYMIEDLVTEEAKEKGTTLIMFSHHTDLEGKESSEAGTGKISLTEGIANNETCREAVVGSLPFGMGQKAMGAIFSKDNEVWKPHVYGGMLAFSESILYMTAFWAGGFGSLLQQISVAPKLQDCVDVDEGYYTHIYAPVKKEAQTEGDAQVISTDKAMNLAEGFSDQLLGMFQSDTNSYTSEAAKKLDDEVKAFFDSTEQNDIVQATVEMRGYSSGKLSGEQLFSFWFKGETSPLEYKDEGMKKINSADGNQSVIVDFETGKIYTMDANGNTVLLTDNNNITRLSSTNTNIPAEEFAKRLTTIGLPMEGVLLFEMDSDGRMFVKVKEVIDCIREGIEFQTGIEASQSGGSSFDLSKAFGKVQSVVSDSHPSIRAWPNEDKIVAEGTPRTSIEGENSMVKIYADRNTYLWKPDQNRFVGLLKSIQFENGVIVYKPDTHELIVWLKRHELGQLGQDDVADARFVESHVINPETNCPEPAVNLEVLAGQSTTAAYKVNAFNEALQNVGPFTVLETPSRRFVFFSRYEEDGICSGLSCCQDYIRVIDKETGEIYEAPIDQIDIGPDGIKILDGNGKEHNIGLTAENGVPMITYNNYPPEPLTNAQGPNGAFWYDPERGVWTAENAQLLPLLEAFRNGSLTQVGANGNVSSVPGNNIVNTINTGSSDGGLLNLPSLPENPFVLFLFILALVFVNYTFVYRKRK